MTRMDERIADLLEDIKRLLILDLVAKGVQAKNIAEVLGVANSTIAGIVSTRRIKKG